MKQPFPFLPPSVLPSHFHSEFLEVTMEAFVSDMLFGLSCYLMAERELWSVGVAINTQASSLSTSTLLRKESNQQGRKRLGISPISY